MCEIAKEALVLLCRVLWIPITILIFICMFKESSGLFALLVSIFLPLCIIYGILRLKSLQQSLNNSLRRLLIKEDKYLSELRMNEHSNCNNNNNNKMKSEYTLTIGEQLVLFYLHNGCKGKLTLNSTEISLNNKENQLAYPQESNSHRDSISDINPIFVVNGDSIDVGTDSKDIELKTI